MVRRCAEDPSVVIVNVINVVVINVVVINVVVINVVVVIGDGTTAMLRVSRRAVEDRMGSGTAEARTMIMLRTMAWPGGKLTANMPKRIIFHPRLAVRFIVEIG